jgi:DNA recombination protein RmuC
MDFIYLITGLIIGAAAIWLINKNSFSKEKKNHELAMAEFERKKIEEFNELDKGLGILEEKNNQLTVSKDKIEKDLTDERNQNEQLTTRIAKAEVEYKNLKEKLDTQKGELEEIQKKFTMEFENIASKILKQNSSEFTQINQKNMGDILDPLKEKILHFEKKVEDTYQKGLKDQTGLQAELKKLYELNFRISEEANNLTRALKSDTKKQGNWGEIILEKVLERSGLVKGQEYDTQTTTRNEAGELIRPDVVVNLPDNKHIIIDSKVSLVAYEAFINEDDDEKRERFLKQHIDSIKIHIKGLSEKNYQNATLFDTPDFVLLFMPIESAFSTAIQTDINLFNIAWEKKIVMVSPTTLLATLRTIASIWKHEKQTQNAIEIARQGGALYDKFVNLVDDMEKMGNQLNTVQKTFDAAKNKLVDGKGNLITQVDKLKRLGAKASKNLPEKYLNQDE